MKAGNKQGILQMMCKMISFIDLLTNSLITLQILSREFTEYQFFKNKIEPPHEKTNNLLENKDADQLRGNREADQRLCFRYLDSTLPLLLKSEISSF